MMIVTERIGLSLIGSLHVNPAHMMTDVTYIFMTRLRLHKLPNTLLAIRLPYIPFMRHPRPYHSKPPRDFPIPFQA